MKTKLRKFENVQDPFNPTNHLTGYINIEEGESYGQILLTHINGMKCKEQTIYTTPKMYYPFNREGSFYFKFLKETCNIYDKLDGTNILSYSYIYRKKEYITYKTRINPVLRKGSYGDFLTMWKEMLNKYPEIPKITKERGVNLSFELYGIVNKHLILYPIRLDAKLLFAINRKTGDLILPEEFPELSAVEKYGIIKPTHFFPDVYKRVKGEIENTNNYISDSEVEGLEGCVIYIRNEEGKYKQWKLKPETIFKIHTAPGINKKDIMITCYNALENVDLEELSYEFVADLLTEEFPEQKVRSQEYIIKRTIEEVKEEVIKRYKVIELYNEIGLSLKEDKNILMREISKHLPKNKMQWAYTVLKAYEQVN